MATITTEFNQFISALAQELEVPEEHYAQAERSYMAFGKWTQRPESTIAKFDPEIYVQGSFRLGTAIKPLSRDGEYDIDSVCALQNRTKDDVTQEQLRKLVEVEVRSYHSAQGIKKPVTSSRRCLTLEYSDGAQFHMDILPAIPNADDQRMLLKKPFS